MKEVAVLCCSPRSIYKKMHNVEAYDRHRDCLTYDGHLPIVAHPPCRSWSAFRAHMAKPLPGEKELAPYCIEKLKINGGVLEHPGHSRVFSYMNLPMPGCSKGNMTTIQVFQYWWGYPVSKKTWLCFFDIDIDKLVVPFRENTNKKGTEGDMFLRMSAKQRSNTTPDFARWLVNAAKLVGV